MKSERKDSYLESLFLSPANFDAELRVNRNLFLFIRAERCQELLILSPTSLLLLSILICSECSRLENEVLPQLSHALEFLPLNKRVELATFRIVSTHSYDAFLEKSEILQQHGYDLQAKGYALFLNKKSKEDRTCLIKIFDPEPTLVKFDSSMGISAELLLHFINSALGTFLNVDGSQNERGALIDRLNANVYTPQIGDHCGYVNGVPTRRQFLEMVSGSRPTILRGVANHWPALSKWNNQFLAANFGCEDASLWSSVNDKPIPEVVLEQLESPSKVVTRPADLQLKISELLLLFNRSDELHANFYLEYFPIKEVPSMMRDINDFEFAENLLTRDMFNVWLGNGRTLGKLHFDPFDNLLVMIAGRKNVTLIDPHSNEDVYEGHIREAKFEYDFAKSTFSRTNLMDSTSLVMSPVNIKNPDLTRYPRFKSKIGRFVQCDIAEGDALFLPAFWWHEVQSEPDRWSRNIAVNYWYKPFLIKEFPCPSCRLAFNFERYSHLLSELEDLL